MKDLRENILIRLNFFVALCASSLVVQTEIISSGRITLSLETVLVFLGTLLVYNGHRLMKLLKTKERSDMFKIRTWIVAICVALIIPLLIQLNQFSLIIVGVGSVIATVYTIDLFQKRRSLVFLRSGWLKAFSIAFVWTILTVQLPISGQPDAYYWFLMFVTRFCFLFAIALPFDIRDMEHDQRLGFSTLPLQKGVPFVRNLSLFSLFAFACCLMVFTIRLGLNPLYFIAYALSIAMSAIVIWKARASQPKYYFSFYLEGMTLLQSILVLIVFLMFREHL